MAAKKKAKVEDTEGRLVTDARKKFGAYGEDLATTFFVQRGFKIIHRNWSCRLGEIDLVVEKNGVTHFIEVKTRHTTAYGYPEEAITRTKLVHLRRAIETYLRAVSPFPRSYQADALAITCISTEPTYHYVEHIL